MYGAGKRFSAEGVKEGVHTFCSLEETYAVALKVRRGIEMAFFQVESPFFSEEKPKAPRLPKLIHLPVMLHVHILLLQQESARTWEHAYRLTFNFKFNLNVSSYAFITFCLDAVICVVYLSTFCLDTLICVMCKSFSGWRCEGEIVLHLFPEKNVT